MEKSTEQWLRTKQKKLIRREAVAYRNRHLANVRYENTVWALFNFYREHPELDPKKETK